MPYRGVSMYSPLGVSLIVATAVLAILPLAIGAAEPSPASISLAPVMVGQSVQSVSRHTNRFPGTCTLRASWHPIYPANTGVGVISENTSGPFSLPNGQRWELRGQWPGRQGEGQDVAVAFTPIAPGRFTARFYLWWECAWSFSWEAAYDVTGIAIPDPRKAAWLPAVLDVIQE